VRLYERKIHSPQSPRRLRGPFRRFNRHLHRRQVGMERTYRMVLRSKTLPSTQHLRRLAFLLRREPAESGSSLGRVQGNVWKRFRFLPPALKDGAFFPLKKSIPKKMRTRWRSCEPVPTMAGTRTRAQFSTGRDLFSGVAPGASFRRALLLVYRFSHDDGDALTLDSDEDTLCRSPLFLILLHGANAEFPSISVVMEVSLFLCRARVNASTFTAPWPSVRRHCRISIRAVTGAHRCTLRGPLPWRSKTKLAPMEACIEN